jgi:purine-binding chemotaxis protein CheW
MYQLGRVWQDAIVRFCSGFTWSHCPESPCAAYLIAVWIEGPVTLTPEADLEEAKMTEEKKKLDTTLIQLVTFSIDGEEFGVEILKVQEIIRMMGITRVPRAPRFVEGVINLRGKVIPIVDLRKRFGLEPRERDKDTRIIVIEISSMIVGFIVDSVSEVLRIPASTIEPSPPVVSGLDSEYISGVGKLEDRLLILLDLDRLLSNEEQQVLGQV